MACYRQSVEDIRHEPKLGRNSVRLGMMGRYRQAIEDVHCSLEV